MTPQIAGPQWPTFAQLLVVLIPTSTFLVNGAGERGKYIVTHGRMELSGKLTPAVWSAACSLPVATSLLTKQVLPASTYV